MVRWQTYIPHMIEDYFILNIKFLLMSYKMYLTHPSKIPSEFCDNENTQSAIFIQAASYHIN